MRQRCTGGVRNAGFVAVRATGAEIRNFKVFTGPDMAGHGRKMEKMAKIREIPEKSHDPNPLEIIIFGATDDLLKKETLAKMHQDYHFLFFIFFSSCLTILLILLLLEEMHAATLHGTTRRNNDIQVIKGVCRIIVCTAGPELQRHPIVFQITFTSLVLMLKCYFCTFYVTLWYWRR